MAKILVKKLSKKPNKKKQQEVVVGWNKTIMGNYVTKIPVEILSGYETANNKSKARKRRTIK